MAIFGFLNGSLKMIMNNPILVEGNNVDGKIELTLKKPVSSKGLYLDLYLQTTSITASTKGVSQQTRNQKLTRIDLEGSKEYTPGKYTIPFTFVCPNVFSESMPGQFGQIVTGFLQGARSKKLLITGVLNISALKSISGSNKIIINKKAQ